MVCDFCREKWRLTLPLEYALHEHKAEILDRLDEEGLTLDALRKRLAAATREEEAMSRPAPAGRRLAGAVVRLIRELLGRLANPRAFIPAFTAVAVAVVVLAVLQLRTVRRSDVDHLMPYLTFEKLPYKYGNLRGEQETEALRFFQKGMIRYKEDDYEGAAEYLGKATEKIVDSGQWWLYLGVSYYLDRRGGEAVKALAQAERLTTGARNVQSRWYLAQSYILAGEAGRAIPLLKGIADQREGYAEEASSLLNRLDSSTR